MNMYDGYDPFVSILTYEECPRTTLENNAQEE